MGKEEQKHKTLSRDVNAPLYKWCQTKMQLKENLADQEEEQELPSKKFKNCL